MFNLPTSREALVRFGACGIDFYRIPKWAKMLTIMAAPGAAGGAGGASGAAGTARVGGQGGQGSAIYQLVVPTIWLPDKLDYSIGGGGSGGGSNASGSPGVGTNVTMGRTGGLVLINTNTSAGGLVSSAVASSFSTTVQQVGLAYLSSYAQIYPSIAGSGGVNTGANGNSPPIGLNNAFFTGGAGGAGVGTGNVAFAGGAVTLRDGTVQQATGTGTNGIDGFTLMRPFTSYPGSGGASNGTGTGGNGGKGGFGMGGGGGGAGVTGGSGGRGGDGFLFIIPS